MESGYHDTGFYLSMPSSLGAQQTTKERMSEGSYGNPLLYGNGNTKHCKLCRTKSIFIYTSTSVLHTWPVIICKITDIPKWENTPVQNKTRKAIIESS